MRTKDVDRRSSVMWEQSMQVEALRLLSEWWDASGWSRMPWRRRPTIAATATDVVTTPAWPRGTKVVAGPTSIAR